MNDKVSKRSAAKSSPQGGVTAGEHVAFDLDEIKRDMRNAQLVDWIKQHQSHLIAAVVILLVLLAGLAMWINKNRAERNTAATIYDQALATVNDADKEKLLQALVSRHLGTAYTPLAQMQLARLDPAHAQTHLRAVINNSDSMSEWVWQARLDLAQLLLDQGKLSAAMPLLQRSVGAAYEQLRQFLLAQASVDPAEKIKHLKLAQAAQSHDHALKQRIDNELQTLEAKNPLAGS